MEHPEKQSVAAPLRPKIWIIIVIGIVGMGAAILYRMAFMAQPGNHSINQAGSAQNLAAQTLLETANQLTAQVAAHPGDIQLRKKLAGVFTQLGRFDLAARQWETAAAENPDSEDVQVQLAQARLLARQFGPAEEGFQSIIKRWPRDAAAREGLAAALYQQKRFREAVLAASNAVHAAPEDKGSHYLLAVSELEYVLEQPDPSAWKPDLQLAKEELNKLEAVWPQPGDIGYRLGLVYFAMKDWKNSELYLTKARGKVPAPECYTYLVAASIQAGHKDMALQTARDGVALFPNRGESHDLLAQALEAAKGISANREVITEYTRAVELEPHNEPLLERLGTAYLRANDMQAAQKAFETANALDPNRVAPYEQLTAIYSVLGASEKATRAAEGARAASTNEKQLKHYQNLVVEHPEDINAHLVLGDRYHELGWAALARNEYMAAFQLDPHNARARAGLDTVGGVPTL